MKLFNLRIMTNKKYKKLIKDREWALENFTQAYRKIRKQQKDIDLLLINNSKLRDAKRKLEREILSKQERTNHIFKRTPEGTYEIMVEDIPGFEETLQRLEKVCGIYKEK